MSHNSAPPTMIEILVRFTYGGNDYDVVLTDKDFVGENFEAHKSLCNDASFHLGGCVSEWIKFTTTRMTFLDGNEVEHPIPWDKSALQVCVATTPIQPSDTYNYVRSFGVYFGQSYTEKVNHSQVEVTAYDYMYLINNFDVTDWYNNYAGTYPNGRAIDTFWTDFSGWLQQAVFAKYNYPTTPNMSYSPALMSVYAYKERLFWCPKPSINSGGSIVQTDLFSGVVTAGMIIKGLAAAFGTNAYLFYPDTVGSSVKGRLYFFEIGDYAQDSVSLAPTDYFAFEYSSFDTTPYTNLRMAVYEALWKANNNEDMTYGFANNWVFNSMSNIEIIDDPTIGDDPTPLQTVAQLLLARFNNVNNGIFRPMSVTTDKYFEIGQQIVVTDTDGNVYNSIIMQRDYTGIYGKSITYTCIGTEDYFKEGDIGGENAVSGSLSDLSGKVPIEGGTSSSVASWEIKPSGVDLKKSGSSVMKIDNNGLSIDAKSIKKNGTELATVATSGSYNDLSNKPTSLPASDVYAWAKATTKPSYSASEVGAVPGLTAEQTGNYAAAISPNGVNAWLKLGHDTSPGVLPPQGGGAGDGHGAIGTEYWYWKDIWVDRINGAQPLNRNNGTLYFVIGFIDLINAGYLRSDYQAAGYPLNDFCEALTRYINNNYGTGTRIIDAAPSDREMVILECYGGQENGAPLYTSGLIIGLGRVLYTFGYYNKVWSGLQQIGSSSQSAVSSVNGKTGAVTLGAADVGAVAIDGGALYIREVDNRNTDYPPSAYRSFSGFRMEFKYANVIGVSTTARNNFGMLFTAIPWENSSGGDPVQIYMDYTGKFLFRCATSESTWGAWQDIMSGSWSGGQISNSGIAYANANNEIGWVAGFGSQGYLKLTGGRTSGKTGLLDVVADTWVLEGANSTSGYNKWIYHGKLGTNRFQCGTLAFSAAGSNSVTFSGAFGGTPIVSLTVQGNSNVYVRTYSLSASAMYITVSGACTVHWMAYYNA